MIIFRVQSWIWSEIDLEAFFASEASARAFALKEWGIETPPLKLRYPSSTHRDASGECELLSSDEGELMRTKRTIFVSIEEIEVLP